MIKQYSKINFQVQTQLRLLDISAQIQFCRFFLFQANCSDQAETFFNGFLLFSQCFEWSHQQSATILDKYELVDKLLVHA